MSAEAAAEAAELSLSGRARDWTEKSQGGTCGCCVHMLQSVQYRYTRMGCDFVQRPCELWFSVSWQPTCSCVGSI